MINQATFDQMKTFANKAVESLTKSVTAFNFVEMAKEKLLENGFKQILEKDNCSFSPGDNVFYTRNNSCIVALTVGKMYDEKKSCFKIIGAHTDSPSLRIAPNSYNPSGELERYNIQTYGGGLWHTWFDRDLSVAGKVVFKNSEGKLDSKIIKCDEPLFIIPNLPPHLKNERNKLEWNNEAHLKPLIATTLVSSSLIDTKGETNKKKDKKLGSVLRTVILRELTKTTGNQSLKEEDIIDYDLCLYDTQQPRLVGLNGEFLTSGRLDNLGSSVPAIYAMIEVGKDEIVNKQSSINVIALFDNEEIGSMTYQGADSNFFYTHLKRIYYQSSKAPSEDGFLAMCNRSFVISADLAHAFHPNYPEKYQANHRCYVQQGVVIKINANGRYSSDSEGGAIMKEIAKKCNVPIQEFIVPQDSPCGTTIGPIITSKIGIKSVDIGIPQFAMHSIREVLGICDLYYYKSLFEEFFKSFEEVKGNLLDK